MTVRNIKDTIEEWNYGKNFDLERKTTPKPKSQQKCVRKPHKIPGISRYTDTDTWYRYRYGILVTGIGMLKILYIGKISYIPYIGIGTKWSITPSKCIKGRCQMGIGQTLSCKTNPWLQFIHFQS